MCSEPGMYFMSAYLFDKSINLSLVKLSAFRPCSTCNRVWRILLHVPHAHGRSFHRLRRWNGRHRVKRRVDRGRRWRNRFQQRDVCGAQDIEDSRAPGAGWWLNMIVANLAWCQNYAFQERTLKKFKQIKWWCQSFLVGVPKIVCGFRDGDGVVEKVVQVQEQFYKFWAGLMSILNRFIDLLLYNPAFYNDHLLLLT